MSSLDIRQLKGTIINYIGSLMTASYVEVEILKVTTDKATGNVVAEGTYETGIFSDAQPFRIEFDKAMNPISINLQQNKS